MAKKRKQRAAPLQFGDMILTTWRDCTGTGAWSSLHDEPLEPITVRQLGFFLHKDKDTLHIAQGLPNEECQVLGMSVLPIGCVVSVERVLVHPLIKKVKT